jgi:hypothetical protein
MRGDLQCSDEFACGRGRRRSEQRTHKDQVPSADGARQCAGRVNPPHVGADWDFVAQARGRNVSRHFPITGAEPGSAPPPPRRAKHKATAALYRASLSFAAGFTRRCRVLYCLQDAAHRGIVAVTSCLAEYAAQWCCGFHKGACLGVWSSTWRRARKRIWIQCPGPLSMNGPRLRLRLRMRLREATADAATTDWEAAARASPCHTSSAGYGAWRRLDTRGRLQAAP